MEFPDENALDRTLLFFGFIKAQEASHVDPACFVVPLVRQPFVQHVLQLSLYELWRVR